jgi:tetratricopeptide (TPR) repeat protein
MSARTLAAAIGTVFLLAARSVTVGRAEPWLEVRSPHFTLVSDAGEKKGRRVAREFEAFRSLIMTVTSFRVDPGRPITILAVKDEAAMRSLLPRSWEGKPGVYPAGVFVRGDDRHYIALRADFPGSSRHHVVHHEYVHLLTEINFRLLPLWLWEGLAAFYGETEFDAERVRWGQLAASHREVLNGQRWVPLEALLTAGSNSPYYTEARWVPSFYAEAAALTHYLLLGPPQARRSFEELCRLLGDSGTDEEATTRVLGDLGELERALRAYAKGNSFFLHDQPMALGNPVEVKVRTLPSAEALAVRGDFMARTGAAVEALPLLEQALAQDDGLALAYSALARAHLTAWRRAEARRVLDQALQKVPEDSVIQFWAASALPRTGDAAWAALKEQRLRRSIELDPGFATALRSLADFYQTQGVRLEEAAVLARRASDLEPQWFGARVTLAEVLRKAGQSGPAQEVEQRLRRYASTNPDYLLSLAYYFDRSGRPEEADAMVFEARTRRPKDPTTLGALGAWLKRRHRYDEADAAFREALVISPDAPSLLNNLGYMNAERGQRVAEALRLIDRALEKVPQHAAYLDSRGWALFRLGRRAEAERTLRTAVAQGENPVFLDHLADVLHARGALAEALALWRRALEGGAAEDGLKETMEEKARAAEEELSSPPDRRPGVQ